MPSYDQLDNEAAWRDESTPAALKRLADGLRAHWPGAGVWTKGDNAHLRGYHRSRRWVKTSAYCTNRTYSVSRTSGDVSGGDSNWVAALDLGSIPQSELHAVCKRLDAAVRAGLLEKVTEWYGNFGNDDRVDGYDNISNRLASSDSSHMFHLHMSFDRGRANEDHSDLLAILTGEDMADIAQHDWDHLRWRVFDALVAGHESAAGPADIVGQHIWIVRFLKALDAKVNAIGAKVDLDPDELAAIEAAASAGAEAGVAKGADELAAALAPLLDLDEAVIKTALAEVLGQARITVVPAAG